MSLLMDALRKAEQQKQKLSTQSPTSGGNENDMADDPAGDLSLEPILAQQPSPAAPALAPASRTQHDVLPELPSSLEALDEQFLAHATPRKPTPRPVVADPPPVRESPPSSPQPPPPLSGTDIARDNVRNVFEAKQPQPRNNRNFAVAVGLVSLVAVIGIGAYFWWQLLPKGNMMLPADSPSVRSPAPPAAPPASHAVPPAPTFIAPPAIASVGHDEKEDAPSPARHETRAVGSKPAVKTPAAPPPATPVRKTTTVEKTDPLLVQAYEAYHRGETELARQTWQKVLAGDSRNPDALRGLAVVAQQNRQWDEAVGYYQRVLDVDPKDAIAQAGLMALKAPTDMIQAESRLRTLLAEQPDSAHLHFALGNQLARQQRWAEAQQAYFKAYSTEPGNASYAFNLAVSLDQLHQAKLAIRYYHEAMATAERQPGQPAGFDRTEVLNRLDQLQAAATP